MKDYTMYCIECGYLVDMVSSNFHILNKYAEKDWVICDGPFTTCHPPEMTEEVWDAVFANEPSQEELEAINQDVEFVL